MKPDIETRNDLKEIMTEFYAVALCDEEIGRHFVDLDLAAHIPVTVDFWEKALFARPVYFGNILAVHQAFHEKEPMTPRHFARWIEIFTGVVDKLFAGERAEDAKLRARMIADTLDQRLNADAAFTQLGNYLQPS